MIVKVHKKDGRTIVAVCDDELLGKKFEQDGKQLDLASDFYNGDKYTDKQLVGDMIRNADVINLVGTISVSLGIEEGLIDKENVINIDGIPHAQAAIEHE
ncbi:DUF424 family protein [Candidatus Woesearchaeota archaeon]|nr:DUF424 family protein [Candidatus Woesearchaeota archaeon]